MSCQRRSRFAGNSTILFASEANAEAVSFHGPQMRSRNRARFQIERRYSSSTIKVDVKALIAGQHPHDAIAVEGPFARGEDDNSELARHGRPSCLTFMSLAASCRSAR